MKIILTLPLITIVSLTQSVISQTTTVQHVLEQSYVIGTTQISVIEGDITQQQVDAIVNAANEYLNHGDGVAGAISKAAGKGLQEYSDQMPIISKGECCPMGKAVITPAFDLEKIGIKKIIHTTGPRGTTTNKEQLLHDAYTSSLQLAKDNGLKSIAFPAISTGILGYNINDATPIALKTIKDFVIKNPKAFDEIRFVVFSHEDFAVYQKCMNELLNASTSNSKGSKFPFENRVLNVVTLSGLGIIFSIIAYHSNAMLYEPESHYSIAYPAAIAPFLAVGLWTVAADNVLELYKSYKNK
jgi:O-acetyl-ADP-ribose deacetylase